MKVVQVSKPGADFEIVERPIPEPAAGQVRIKVESCGVCHSDFLTKQGYWPGIQYPRVPGHEIIGTVDAVGADVPNWKAGQRVGVGWYAGHCGHCDSCRRGKFVLCKNGTITGISVDGGYGEYMLASFNALAAVPDNITSKEGGPLMCAGVTTFNALRNSGAQAGDIVGVVGVGGLGHLGVQYAAKMGFKTVAIARGQDKAAFVKQLGAHHYIDSQAGDIGPGLQRLGGAKVIIATATDAKAISAAVPGLAPDGKLIVLGAPGEPLSISALDLIGARRSVQGWPSGASIDSQDTLAFSELMGIKPMIEEYPLVRAAEAYERMMSGKARFRVVLTMDHKSGS